MKKILSFVLLVAMLATLMIPAVSAGGGSEVVSITAESAEVMEGGKTLSSKLAVKDAAPDLTSVSVIVFWAADAGVEEVNLNFDTEAFDTENTGTGTIYAGNNNNVKNQLAPYSAATKAYKACKIDFIALNALEADADLGTLGFVFADASKKGDTFSYSVAIISAGDSDENDLEYSEDKVDATLTVVEDPNLGLYTDFTVFAVPEKTDIAKGATTLKVDVRIDANPGIYGAAPLIILYPDTWTIASDACGSIYDVSCYSCGNYDASAAANTGYLKDRLASFPGTEVDGYSFVTCMFECDGPTETNSNNGVLVSYVFNVPSDMEPGDTADFSIIFDKEGDIVRANEDGTFTYFAPASVGATVTMKCDHPTTSSTVVAPTCTEEGYTTDKCTVCGAAVGTKHDIVVALGHNEVTIEEVAATCTTAGATAGKQCTRCHEITVAPTPIGALGHDEAPIVAIPATCTTAGATAGVKCNRCGDILTTPEPISALGHSYTIKNTTLSVAPTCTVAGTDVFDCANGCGTTDSKTVDALGHSYTIKNTTLSVAPTCTVAGTDVFDCANGCGTTDSKTVDALGHDFDYENGVVTAPTTTVAGYTTYTCTRCPETDTVVLADGLFTYTGDIYYLAAGIAQTGVIKVGDNYCYFAADGKFEAVNGAMTVDGADYYFADGIAKTDCVLKVEGAYRYYAADGKFTAANGYTKVGESYYYLNNGLAKTLSVINVDGTYRYFRGDGKFTAVTRYLKVRDNYYYLDKGIAKTDSVVKERTYLRYFNAEGKFTAVNGFKNVNGSWYYFKSGVAVADYVLKFNGNFRYFGVDGKLDATVKGAKQVGDNSYYFANGYAKTYCVVGGRYYRADGKFAPITRKLTIDGKVYNLVNGIAK